MVRRTLKSRPSRRRSAVRLRIAIPADETNLMPEERAGLPDPGRVTEDDGDAIISHRRMRAGKRSRSARS